MDVYIDREPLVRGLARMQSIAEKSDRVLGSHIHMEVRDGGLILTATDGALSLVNRLAARPEADGVCTVNASKLYASVRLLQADVVRLTWNAKRGALSIRSGSTEYKLNGTDGTDFPQIPKVGGASTDAKDLPLQPRPATLINMTIGAATLRRLIAETFHSVSTDDNRYGLNGAHLERVKAPDEVSFRLRMVTTDGNRLSLSDAAFDGDCGLPKKTLIPRRVLVELKKLLDDTEGSVSAVFDERFASFSTPTLTLFSPLVAGEFPDYRHVLPTSAKRRATIEREALVGALRRVELMASDRNSSARFSFDASCLLLSATDAKTGDAREEVPMELEGAPLVTGFNVKYLLDILNNTQCKLIQFDMGEALDSCVLRVPDRDDCLFVIMPMRLD